MENEKKAMLIATFIPKCKIEWFINYINKKFNIKQDLIYIYEVEDNDLDYLLTFKLKNDKRIDFKFHFTNATIVNTKCGCIFSINGLNRLIEQETGCEIGNVNYGNHQINWLDYNGKLVLSNKNNLSIKNIKKIVLNCDKNSF